MRIYSDTLNRDHLIDAARSARVGFDTLETLRNTRVRSHGWLVRLIGSSRRPRNTGTVGADTGGTWPATWNEHGHFMAALYSIDPNARIAYYNNLDEFNFMTKGAFSKVTA